MYTPSKLTLPFPFLSSFGDEYPTLPTLLFIMSKIKESCVLEYISHIPSTDNNREKLKTLFCLAKKNKSLTSFCPSTPAAILFTRLFLGSRRLGTGCIRFAVRVSRIHVRDAYAMCQGFKNSFGGTFCVLSLISWQTGCQCRSG